jgi:hypothetical protein
MTMHIQDTAFSFRPRVRIYRRPLLIWLRWLGKAAFIERPTPAVTPGVRHE